MLKWPIMGYSVEQVTSIHSGLYEKKTFNLDTGNITRRVIEGMNECLSS